MTAIDPNDQPAYLSRWEPYILGCITGIVHMAPAEVIGLRITGAWPDVPSPYMFVSTRAGVDGGAVQHYRITVERATPPPEDDEG